MDVFHIIILKIGLYYKQYILLLFHVCIILLYSINISLSLIYITYIIIVSTVGYGDFVPTSYGNVSNSSIITYFSLYIHIPNIIGSRLFTMFYVLIGVVFIFVFIVTYINDAITISKDKMFKDIKQYDKMVIFYVYIFLLFSYLKYILSNHIT